MVLQGYLPNTDELNINVNRERLLESVGLFPASLVRGGVHLVGEGDLLGIACW